MHSTSRPLLRWLALPCLAIGSTGCNQSELEKVVVEGTVQYDGAPIQNGEIRFYPTGETPGPVSGAPIVDGRYRAEAKGGVPVGTHKVEIRGFRAPGAPAAGGNANQAIPGGTTGAPEQYVPDQYNTHSTLEYSVDGTQRVVQKDFELTP